MSGKLAAGHTAEREADECPEHPGFIIRREYLEARGLTVHEAARRLGLSIRTVSEVTCCKRDVSERTGLCLEREGVRTALEWQILQARYDDWQRRNRHTGTNGSSASAAPG